MKKNREIIYERAQVEKSVEYGHKICTL